MSLKIDSREFQSAMREYMKHTQRDVAEVLNQKSFSILLAASKLTFAPMAETIRQTLGVIGYRIGVITRGKNAGKIKRGRAMVGNNSLAERIVRSKLYASGAAQPTADEGRAMAEKFVGRRVAAIGYLRAGFLAAIFGLAGAIGIKSKPSSRNAFKRTSAAKRGGASPARPGWRPECSFWNTSAARTNDNEGVAGIAADGLQAAINQEIRRMDEHIAKKLQSTASRYSAR